MSSNLPDFDELRKMAQEDPEGLQEIKRRMIEDIIDNAPEEIKRRLRGLQFQADSCIKSSKTPMTACIGMNMMMRKSLNRLNTALQSLIGKGDISEAKPIEMDAEIIEFKKGK